MKKKFAALCGKAWDNLNHYCKGLVEKHASHPYEIVLEPPGFPFRHRNDGRLNRLDGTRQHGMNIAKDFFGASARLAGFWRCPKPSRRIKINPK